MSDQPDVDELVDDGPEGEKEFERPTKKESAIGRLGARVITLFPKPLIGIRETLFKRMAIKSIENYHKIAGGDALAINAKAGQQVEFEPILYRTPEEVEEGEKPGWKVKGRDKVWNPGKEGYTVDYLGRTPTVLLEDDDHVEAGWLAPRIGQAIEMDQYWPLFTSPTFNVTLDYESANMSQQAIADGGHASQPIDFTLNGVEEAGEWMGDNIVDLDSGDGYDGMRISTNKAREWRAEEADSEHMQMQEDRGYLRGLANGDEGPSVFKLLLLCAAIILGTLAIIFIGPQLLGGDGGTSINPLMVNVLGSMGAV